MIPLMKRNRPRSSPPNRVRLVKRSDGTWEFQHPRCVRERVEDIHEVREMLEHEEYDLAEETLRWLLEGCSDFIEAHMLLGRIAESEGRLDLARAHYGYAFEIGRRAMPRGFKGPLPSNRPANRPWYEAAAGLLRCLTQQGELKKAEEVLQLVAECDPSVNLAEL